MSLYAGLIPNDSGLAADTESEKKKNEAEAEAGKASGAAGWLASKQLMAPQLLRKKQQASATPQQAKPAIRAALLATAPLVPATGNTELPVEPFYHAEFSLVPVENEYDPFRPNDYEAFVEEREERKRKKKEEEEAEKRRRRERKEGRSERGSRHSDFAPMPPPMPEQPSTPAALNLNESAAEAIARRLRMSGKPVPAAAPTPQNKGGGSYGARLLGQMGWKEGQGLGKSEQGIATPLIMEKTGKAKGVIVPSASTTLLAKATRVIMLENMVGPGEVDDDLQPEVAEECSKYGKVTKCLIFEVPGGQVPDDQAVRIFVEFDRVESARKGLLGLNNRFFGGRTVRASFYDEGKFARFDLAPEL